MDWTTLTRKRESRERAGFYEGKGHNAGLITCLCLSGGEGGTAVSEPGQGDTRDHKQVHSTASRLTGTGTGTDVGSVRSGNSCHSTRALRDKPQY